MRFVKERFANKDQTATNFMPLVTSGFNSPKSNIDDEEVNIEYNLPPVLRKHQHETSFFMETESDKIAKMPK